MPSGYGFIWGAWDAFVADRFGAALAALGDPKYRNLEAFRSPQGRWMAFHATDYADIRIVDLETRRTVVEHFYSNGAAYGHHVNVSTHVPTFRRVPPRVPDSPDTWDRVVGNAEVSIEDLWSMPLAFNAYTYWAADHELYVDVLDLSRVDEGIVRRYADKASFVIPVSADRVRDYVQVDLESYVDMKPKDGAPGVLIPSGTTSGQRGEYISRFRFLTERQQDEVGVDMRTGKTTFRWSDQDGARSEHSLDDAEPWKALTLSDD